jgi:arsenite methyltransferase
MDSFIAAHAVGPDGRVVGIDMTPEMIDLASSVALSLGLQNAEFRPGLIEDLPLEPDWADVVISNGVINLCPDKLGVYQEIFRVLKPGGRMTIADICVEKPIPESTLRDIDLWTGWIAGALPCAGWETVIGGAGLIDVELDGEVDTFGGASGEGKARQFGTTGYSIRAVKPPVEWEASGLEQCSAGQRSGG